MYYRKVRTKIANGRPNVSWQKNIHNETILFYFTPGVRVYLVLQFGTFRNRIKRPPQAEVG